MGETGLKVAVVGGGGHATNTVYPAMIAAGYDIRAVATRHQERAAEVARRFGGLRAFDSVEGMLEAAGGEVEAVVLVLPADGYEETILKVLPTGLPIYCEKPVALDAATLQRVEAARSAAGSTVMVGYMKRFAPAYQRARELAADPAFGGATAYNAYWGMGAGFNTLDFLMRENATHHLDLARYLMGEVADVAAWAHEPEEKSMAAAILLRFESGAVGTLQVNNCSAWDHDNEWVSITGRGPVVIVDNVDTCVHRVPGQGERRWRPNYTVPIPSTSSLHVTGFTGALRHFTEVVREGAVCRADLASALATMELAERVLAAAGQRVAVPA